jgi:hypothetical protein
MRAFFVACLVAVVLGGVAAYVLNSGYLPDEASAVFATRSVRI